ncbi:MAG: hypothetical protein IJF71_04540, partial [Clostridia bacterium]|nr:hypothetical protein [Clostridia bacterium]
YATLMHCYNDETTVVFDGYSNIAWNEIAPRMGKIVGRMDDSVVMYVSVDDCVLDAGDLPNRTNNGSIFNKWHYPKEYIGACCDGAAGQIVNGSLTEYDWVPGE